MEEKKRKSMAVDAGRGKLPKIEEEEEFVDSEPLSLPRQPFIIERKNGKSFIVSLKHLESVSKFMNKKKLHTATFAFDRYQDRVNRLAVHVEQCNANILHLFSAFSGEDAASCAVQSKATAASFSQSLKNIISGTLSLLAATEHFFQIITRHMFVPSAPLTLCTDKIMKQTTDVDVEELVVRDHHLLSSIFMDKQQALMTLSRVAVKNMRYIQDCFSVLQSCPTDFVVHTLHLRTVRRLLADIKHATRTQIAGLDKIRNIIGR